MANLKLFLPCVAISSYVAALLSVLSIFATTVSAAGKLHELTVQEGQKAAVNEVLNRNDEGPAVWNSAQDRGAVIRVGKFKSPDKGNCQELAVSVYNKKPIYFQDTMLAFCDSGKGFRKLDGFRAKDLSSKTAQSRRYLPVGEVAAGAVWRFEERQGVFLSVTAAYGFALAGDERAVFRWYTPRENGIVTTVRARGKKNEDCRVLVRVSDFDNQPYDRTAAYCRDAAGLWKSASIKDFRVETAGISNELRKELKQVAQGEKARDDRFIADADGTVLDTKTGLMWAARDSKDGFTWPAAKRYCRNYRAGGHQDWRMPTLDELAGLYDASKSRPQPCHKIYMLHVATDLIYLNCSNYWASATQGTDTAYFDFGNSKRNKIGGMNFNLVIPVRSPQARHETRPQQARDDRFFTAADGTILDTKTGLMWAARDNGGPTNWEEANKYCQNYRGGGYTDWRIPAQAELISLHNAMREKNQSDYFRYDLYEVTGIELTGSPWGQKSNKMENEALFFNFDDGRSGSEIRSFTFGYRALPVRIAK